MTKVKSKKKKGRDSVSKKAVDAMSEPIFSKNNKLGKKTFKAMGF
ncbi:unnamed protein product [marine sediment metagenome]|uniref:Uncharacterized protein n=1 Tax=marine sediment metagenome TaxID=412755 RepID=X0ZCA7_9ZZZZ